MKRSETATLLAKIAAYDRRTVGEADIEAWTEALDGLITLQDAMVAVRDHFRESNDWLMPKSIIDRSKKLRVERIRAAGLPDFPPGLTQTQERAWLKEWHERLSMNPDPVICAHFADRSIGITRIEGTPADPERVRQLIADFAASRSIEAAS